MLSIFSYVSGPSVCPPWRSVCSSPCPFLNWVFCLPRVESCEFFIYFGDQTLVWGIIGKYIFWCGGFPFHFVAVFFSHAKASYFDEVPFVYSFLYVPCSRGYISENIAVWNACLCSPVGLLWYHNLYLSLLSILNLFLCMVLSWWSSFSFLHVAVQLSQHHLLKRLFLLHFIPLPPLSNINWP